MEKKKTIIRIFFAIEFIIYEIIFLYFVFNYPTAIGELTSPINIELKSFVLYYLIIHILVFLITGLLLSIRSLKSEKPDIRMKGIFLLIAFISFAIGATLDVLFPIGFIFNRIILISSAIEFYLGFVTPDWMKKRFLENSD